MAATVLNTSRAVGVSFTVHMVWSCVITFFADTYRFFPGTSQFFAVTFIFKGETFVFSVDSFLFLIETFGFLLDTSLFSWGASGFFVVTSLFFGGTFGFSVETFLLLRETFGFFFGTSGFVLSECRSPPAAGEITCQVNNPYWQHVFHKVVDKGFPQWGLFLKAMSVRRGSNRVGNMSKSRRNMVKLRTKGVINPYGEGQTAVRGGQTFVRKGS